MSRLFKIIIGFINIIAGLGVVLSAVAGSLLDATEFPQIVIITMSFPIWAVTILPVMVINFFWSRKWCLWMAVCTAAALPMVFNVFPLNIPRGEVPDRLKDQAWTLLSYNVSNFFDPTEAYSGNRNPMVEYLLRQDADVAVLEEAYYLRPISILFITDSVLAKVNEKYPYIFVGQDVTILSKFPARVIPLTAFPNQTYTEPHGSAIGAYEVDINGEKIAIIGVHLRSLGLRSIDKDMFEDITKGSIIKENELQAIKTGIIDKIADANKHRAIQIRSLIEEIQRLGYDNVIVCGDFNDTPGSYPLRCLRDIGMTEVYPLVGNGYMNTFHADMMLVRIDHVLFKGDMLPWNMIRDKVPYSDHYPLYTTFVPRR